mmetsp:Transcript_29236/g.37710  ORF Transcript_29236/g.37710 Transcript_29236/m.37710 type:complete len:83 (+) Transcript_29236:517-765(+)
MTRLPRKMPLWIFSAQSLRGPRAGSTVLGSSSSMDMLRKVKHGGIYSPTSDMNPITTVDPYSDRPNPRIVVYTEANNNPLEL